MNNLEQCLKCNLCTLVCPMLEVNPDYPGPKKAGPDGERYRLKDPAFFDYALKYCLNCKRCEVACPSDVHIGDMIQTARILYGSQAKKRGLTGLRDWTLASTDLVGSLASPVAGLANGVLALKPVKSIMHGVLGVDKHRTFPSYSGQKFVGWFKKQNQSAFGHFVSYFHGCYVNYNYPELGKAFVKVMNAAGYGVHLLEKEKCCGVALMSNGFADKARKQGELNIASMRKAVAAGEPVLTTSSTCTFTMRDEYPSVLGVQNADVRDSLMLATKWLYERMASGELSFKFRKDFSLKVAYHTACHMQKMGWALYSTGLLKMIPGVELTILDQNCCGIAGTFGFKKENYKYSQEIGSKLFEDVRSAAADVVSTDCETCKWQIEMSTGAKVLNPIEILASAIDA